MAYSVIVTGVMSFIIRSSTRYIHQNITVFKNESKKFFKYYLQEFSDSDKNMQAPLNNKNEDRKILETFQFGIL